MITSTTKAERAFFASQLEQTADELLLEREYDGIFSIIAPVFKEDNKWRLSDGNSNLNVSIMDKEFLDRVDARKVSFYKGDLLKCKIRTTQWKSENGLKTEHEVLQVINLIQGTQMNLFPLDN